MNEKIGIADRVRNWLFSLPRAALVAGGLAATAVFVTASLYAYRTYDYIQHDNDFCLSCHLMVDPFERFARSAHRELGCKACHQPTIVTRSQMALTQIIENPDSLETHAEVPNARCAECHIEGNPEEWTLVAKSAGHRVHLESQDPTLQGLQCVQCHSTSLHEFSAADKTCGQTDCHTDIRVQLGKMSNLMIHCAACHAFSTPVPDTAGVPTAQRALQPTRNECLSCHAMRALVEMPADDPHEGICSSCHNPHEQTTPTEAVESCARSGCHTQPEAASPMHRGLAPTALEACGSCHPAHDFRVDGSKCIDCHEDILERGTGTAATPRRVAVPPGRGAAPISNRGGPQGSAAHPWMHVATRTRLVPGGGRPVVRTGSATRPPQDVQAPSRPFRHATHRQVDCIDCHSTTDSHGALRIASVRDCQSCHHSARVARARSGCERCHTAGDFPARPINHSQVLQFASGNHYTRGLPFDHEKHSSRPCTECHTQPVTLTAAGLDCTTCHTDHHDPDNDCTACHVTPQPGVHNLRSHLGCDAAGCHRGSPVAAAPATRQLCLSCHQDLADHRPGRNCVYCHPLLPSDGRGDEARRGLTR